MQVQTTVRNASFEDLFDLLTRQQAVKLDAVVPSTAIRSKDAVLHIDGLGTKVEANTVEELLAPTPATRDRGVFVPTEIFDGQIAAKLGIPTRYLRTLREERPDLYDANVNGLLHGRSKRTADGEVETIYPADRRRFLIRTFVDPEGGPGIARAFLSNGFGGAVDHLDPLVALLEVLREEDPDAEVVYGNLSERRLFIRVASPKITTTAPLLLRNYRSPIKPRWNPTGVPQVGDVVAAGFTFSNSETGNGKYLLVPTATILSCTNGATFTAQGEGFDRVHLGSRLDEGIVEWSDETRAKNLELVKSETRDAIRTFLDREYLEKKVAEIEAKADVEISDPAATVEVVAKQLSFSEETARLVLNHFIAGGQTTAGGVFQAVTSAAQEVTDPDLAYDLEAQALTALDIAVATA